MYGMLLEEKLKMINKTKTLGKKPSVLGEKDAIHTPIVSVRAAEFIEPGEWCSLNEHNEAVSSNHKGLGVADPFLTKGIRTGEYFWLCVNPQKVGNVSHMWDHDKEKFEVPSREVEKNPTILECANQFGMDYDDFMVALDKFHKDEYVEYTGRLSYDELMEEQDYYDSFDLWQSWSDETGVEFYNEGSECCPEYNYPHIDFVWKEEENSISECEE
jgi:hypothetical protein